MKKFKDLIIPDEIIFNGRLKINDIKNLIDNNTISCNLLTNSGDDIDYQTGLMNSNKCDKIKCNQCIYCSNNAEKRAEYFRYLKSENEEI